MTRVMVIGNAGGGKSTMCRAVCEAHGLPYYAIDKIQWKPNWVRAPEAEFDAKHLGLLSKDRWLIDGYGSWDSVQARLNASDTIIFVDHPIYITSGGRPNARSGRCLSVDLMDPKVVGCGQLRSASTR